MVKTAQAVTADFVTSHPSTGAAVDADSLPTAVLVVNGTDNAAAVTVTDKGVGAGCYKAAVTLPTLAAGDIIAIRVAATVNAIAGAGIVWEDVADTLYVSDVGTSVTEGTPQNVTANGAGTLTTGTATSGTAALTFLDDASYWLTAPVTPAVGGFGLNESVTFLCGAKRASQVTINGRYSGNGRYANVYAYNYETAAWDLLSDSVTRMNNSSSDLSYTYTLLPAHQKNLTAGDGEVTISWRSPSTTTADRLYLDQVLVKAVAAGATAADIANAVYDKMKYTVYEGGVWIDTVAGTAGTALGVNGIPTNPVLTYADALTIAAALGVKRLYLRPDSSITLTQSHAYWRFIGKGLVHLGGQNIDDARFEGCELIDGVSTGEDADFDQCVIGDVTLGSATLYECSLIGTLTTLAAGVYTLIGSVSGIPGTSTPNLVYAGTGNVAVGLRNYSGGIHIQAMTTGDRMSLEGQGQLKIHTDCTGGTIAVRGAFTVTDEVVGGFLGTLSDVARWAEDQRLANVTLVDTTTDVTNAAVLDHALLDAIKAKTDTIGALAVTVTSPVAADGTLTVEQGDSYPASRSRSITMAVADVSHSLALTAPTCDVYLRGWQFTWPAASVTSTVAGWDIVFEPTIAQTASLAIDQKYKLIACYDNVVPTSDDAATLARGSVVVKRDIPSV